MNSRRTSTRATPPTPPPPPRGVDPATGAAIALAVAIVLLLVAIAVIVASPSRTTPDQGPPTPPPPVAAPSRPAPPRTAAPVPPPAAPEAAPEPEPPAPTYATAWARGATEAVTVAHGADGDALVLSDGRRVRLIGIDAPARGRPVADEAAAALEGLVAGAPVTLEWDRERADRRGQPLAYAFKGDLFVNGELVRRGLAACYTWEPNTAHRSELIAFQREARGAKLGLWALPPPAPEASYAADKEGHRFHRPACAQAASIPAARRIAYSTRDEALDDGQAPCVDCKP